MLPTISVLSLAADRLDDPATAPRPKWRDVARPEQIPPVGSWFVFLYLAGRGAGKTRSAAEWAAEKARRYPGCRIALVAATIADARDTLVEGESGLLSVLDDSELRGGSREDAWNRSLGELFLRNGSQFKTFSSEKPWRLRGPQHHFAIGDEVAFWQDAHKGTAKDTTWSNLTIGLRLPGQPGWSADYRPQVFVSTTPRPVALLKSRDPEPARAGLMQRKTTVIVRGRTVDNLANLSDTYREQVVEPLLGTTLGRQELDAELLEAVEGALWTAQELDEHRVSEPPYPGFKRTVVALDPADGEDDGDEQAITVAGAGMDWRLYVVANEGMRATPTAFLRRAIELAREHDATIVVEKNHGGKSLTELLTMIMRDMGVTVPYRTVNASTSKRTRAEPIAALYEQGKVSHIGTFPQLEDQLLTWTGLSNEPSPDRLDSLVWAIRDLMGYTDQPREGAKRGAVPYRDRRPGGRRGAVSWT